MGFSYGSKGIVTDGLVLYFEPTNPRSGVMPSSGNGINNQYTNVIPYPNDAFAWSSGAGRNHATGSRGCGVIGGSITNAGSLYNNGTHPTTNVSSTGEGCTVTIVTDSGEITELTIEDPGGGYAVDDILQIQDGLSSLDARFTVGSIIGEASPVGKRPLRMECTGSDPYISTYNSSTWNLAAASPGESWDFSVYLKTSYSGDDNPQLFIFGADSTGDIMYDEPEEDFSRLDVDQPTATTEWQKFTHGHTFRSGSNSVEHIQVRIDGDQVGINPHIMWFDGLDVRKSPTWHDPYTGKEGALPGGVIFKDGHTVFNGHTTYGTVKDDTELQITGEISIGAWIKPALKGDDYQRIVNKAAGQSGIDGYSMGLRRSTGEFFLALDGTGAGGTFYTSPGDVVADVWQYVVITADGTNERAYINGEQILKGSNGWTPGSGINRFEIGQASIIDDERFFSGSIDIVQVYNRALTIKEVQQNYNALKWRFQ